MSGPPPSCPRCGYVLIGLERAGNCPECGAPYDAAFLRSLAPTSVRRGLGALVGPPVVAIVSSAFFFCLFFIFGCALIVPTIGLCVLWAWHVSRSAAFDVHDRRVRAHVEGGAPMPSPRSRRFVHVVLFAIDVLLIGAALPAVLLLWRWIDAQGVPMPWVG